MKKIWKVTIADVQGKVTVREKLSFFYRKLRKFENSAFENSTNKKLTSLLRCYSWKTPQKIEA